MTCMWCHKELPTDYKIPLCDYHRARCAETAESAGAAALGAGIFLLNGGGKLIKSKGATAVKTLRSLIR